MLPSESCTINTGISWDFSSCSMYTVISISPSGLNVTLSFTSLDFINRLPSRKKASSSVKLMPLFFSSWYISLIPRVMTDMPDISKPYPASPTPRKLLYDKPICGFTPAGPLGASINISQIEAPMEDTLADVCAVPMPNSERLLIGGWTL